MKKVFTWFQMFLAHRGECGYVDVGLILGGFITIMVVMALIPTLVTNNATIQALAGASEITKLAGNLAEWGLPIGAVAGVIYMFFHRD